MDQQKAIFTGQEIEKLFKFLNEQLEKDGITGEICIVGGAAMILGFGSRHSTQDINALVISPTKVRSAIDQVARENSLPANWLNDGAKGFSSNFTPELKEL